MTNPSPYQTYINVQFNTADQGTLILLAYDGALRFCRAAIACIENQDKLGKGMPLIARYLHSGVAYGFMGNIIGVTLSPLPLIFLSYPSYYCLGLLNNLL